MSEKKEVQKLLVEMTRTILGDYRQLSEAYKNQVKDFNSLVFESFTNIQNHIYFDKAIPDYSFDFLLEVLQENNTSFLEAQLRQVSTPKYLD